MSGFQPGGSSSSNLRQYSRRYPRGRGRPRRLPFSSSPPPTAPQPPIYPPPPPQHWLYPPPAAAAQPTFPHPPADDDWTDEELVWAMDYVMAQQQMERLTLSPPTPWAASVPYHQTTPTPTTIPQHQT